MIRRRALHNLCKSVKEASAKLYMSFMRAFGGLRDILIIFLLLGISNIIYYRKDSTKLLSQILEDFVFLRPFVRWTRIVL